MAITHLTIAVTDDPAVLVFEGTGTPPVSGDRGSDTWIQNTGSDVVYLGGSATVTGDAVAPTGGLQLAAGEKLPLGAVASGDDVYAICAAGDSTTVCIFTLPA